MINKYSQPKYMTTIIALEEVEFFSYHGYYDDEQVMGHRYLIDVETTIHTYDEIEDDINDTVNYESLFNICQEVMEEKERLLEKVVIKILKKIREKHPSVVSSTVSLRKCAPQLGGKVKYAKIVMSD